MLDLFNRLTGAGGLNPAAARTTSANGTAVDISATNNGNNGLTFFVIAGAITDGTHTFKLQDSPDNSTWTDVAAPYVQTGSVTAFTSSTTAGTVIKFGYLGNASGGARYVRAVCTVTGSPSTGGFYSVIAVLGHAGSLPTA